jgi:hypothetical protein
MLAPKVLLVLKGCRVKLVPEDYKVNRDFRDQKVKLGLRVLEDCRESRVQ